MIELGEGSPVPQPELPEAVKRLAENGPMRPFFDFQSTDPSVHHIATLAHPDIVWPEVPVQLNESKLLGHGTFIATRASRLRAVYEAVEDGVLQAVGTQQDTNESELTNNTVIPHPFQMPEGFSVTGALKMAEEFLKKTSSFQGVQYSYKELLSPDLVCGVLECIMHAENHPVTRTLYEIREQYGKQIYPGDLQQLARDTLLSTQYLTIVQMYISFKHELRHFISLRSNTG